MAELTLEEKSGELAGKGCQIPDENLEYFAALDNESLLSVFASDSQTGLSLMEAGERLARFGLNQHSEKNRLKPLKIFLHQFQSSVVALLLAAALASFCYHEYLQACGILAAVFINALTGFYMEFKAGVSLASLQELSGQSIRSIRGAHQCLLPVSELVPGDIVVLEAGCRVPADLRLLESVGLSVDESSLSGESLPVFKDLKNQEASREGTSSNLLYHGTLVVSGRGLALVLKTGAQSSLGKLSNLLESADSGATPLELQLEDLGKQLSYLTLVICAFVSIAGILQKEDLLLMVETGVALAVAAIPEGLPVLATLALAVGTQRMVRNRTILRHLAAVETLGCTSIICTDKTGTLTENKMSVCKLFVFDRLLDTSKEPADWNGAESQIQELCLAGALCNDAKLEFDPETKSLSMHGDPTETALLQLAEKAGILTSDLSLAHPRIGEFPFDLSVKRMSTINQTKKIEGSGVHEVSVLYAKGSPGSLIDLCSKVGVQSGKELELDAKTKDRFMAVNYELAAQGLRVLAVAKREFASQLVCFDRSDMEKDLVLLGLVAIKDPPREGVKEAIEVCKNAGIKVLMLTGDQALTASSIAFELGIIDKNSQETAVLTGKDLQDLDLESSKKILKDACVLARVTPELKLDIVRTLQNDGSIVSMTGDGVNDAPALKQANIGVAMGLKGTDLARSASQMVITDDNFATIVKAIEEGRIIYQNIRRGVCYLLTASLSSVITVALAVLFDLGLPLSPLQLLWLNLIMHIFPGLGLVLQKGDSSVMEQKPRHPKDKLIELEQVIQIFMRSIIVSIVTVFCVSHTKSLSFSDAHMTTVGLATLSFALLFQAFAWLNVDEKRGKKRKLKVGKAMILNMFLAYLLLFAALYMPGLTAVLVTLPLSGPELLYSILLAVLSFCLTSICEKLMPWKKLSSRNAHP